ncbi:hypothetical protein ABTY96_28490 [Streptomyces sp. NPDC096057]|uniref:hypothetical protein n=1 Tax=Streptomyces sp. NPDC096057 TaxID=3155543 RepID=UPI00331C8873
MMQTSITWRLTVSAEGAPDTDDTRAQLDDHFDQVMEGLVKLEACNDNVHDPSLAVNLEKFPKVQIEVELLVDGIGPAALETGETILRTAIHGAGGFTRDWDERPQKGTYYEELSVELERA